MPDLFPTLRAAVTVGLLVLATACSNHEDAPPSAVGATRVTKAADVTLPFDAYELSPEQDRKALQANNVLLKRCGERYGVEVTMPVGVNPTTEDLNGRRYGINDRAYAATHGYDAPPIAADEAGDKSDNAWNPTDSELTVLRGPADATGDVPRDRDGEPVPPGGCLAIVEHEFPSVPPEVDTHETEIYKRAEADKRVRAAKKKWVACMAQKGYSYASPWDPINADWPAKVTEREIRTALDDLDCRDRTNLAGIWLAVESAYQRQEIERNPERFAALEKWHDQRVKRASQVLQGDQ